MALYFYRAFSRDGKKTSGYLDAPSPIAVKEQLARQGLFPISVLPAQEAKQESWWEKLNTKPITTKEKILFTRQLAVLLEAGVPLVKALELLSNQFKGKFKSIIITLKDEIEAGKSFANALKPYPKVFNTIYVQLIRAGEAAGNLETVLNELANFLEEQEEIKKRVRSAMTTPLIQLTVALVVVSFLMIYVVPGMVKAFTKGSDDLPFATAVLLNISNFLKTYYLPFFIFIVVLVASFMYWKSTKNGAYLIDKIKLKLPIVSYFTQMSAITQFCQTLGMLLASGVNLSESLDIVVKVVNNQILAEALTKAKDKIVKQGKIAQYLKQTKLFPPIAIYMISTGEETGNLDSMLLKVAENYGKDLREQADKITELLGPVMLIVMAGLVGFIILAVAQPMVKMMESVNI